MPSLHSYWKHLNDIVLTNRNLKQPSALIHARSKMEQSTKQALMISTYYTMVLAPCKKLEQKFKDPHEEARKESA